MLIDLAGLLAAAVLVITLVALEVRRAGPDAGQRTPRRILGRTVSRMVVAAMWTLYLLFFIPRVWELVT